MKKIILIILILFIFLLVLTNPEKQQYSDFLQNKLNAEMQEQKSHGSDIFGGVFGLIANFGIKYLADSSTRDNYIVFSIYRSKINDNDIVVIGVMKTFFPVDKISFFK